MNNKQLHLLVCLVYSFISACAPRHTLAPVISRSHDLNPSALTVEQANRSVTPSDNTKVSDYMVESGDTLYSIAWNYNLDYRKVAKWNNITEPYIIYPHQLIRLTMPDEPISSNKSIKKQPLVFKELGEDKYVDKVSWQWPTTGRLIKLDSKISRKGLNIIGNKNQPIKAAANGFVVYSGKALLGYGNLVIIKHNDRYLSAYAHNSSIVIKEGDSVTIGQQIGKMGQDSNGRILLHFEIRKDGQYVNPLNYLPSQQSFNRIQNDKLEVALFNH